MSSTARVLILPGRNGSDEKHWQSVWEAHDPSMVRVQQSEWANPDRLSWENTLDAAIKSESSPVILVAHSLAVVLVAHWAQRDRGQVQGALLVSATDVERADYPPGTSGFTPIPLGRLPFRSLVVASDDDPRVTVERAAFFASAWGAEFHTPGAFGHLGSAAELGRWDYGAALLATLRMNGTR